MWLVSESTDSYLMWSTWLTFPAWTHGLNHILISCEINGSSAEAKSVRFAEQAVVTQDEINSFVQLVLDKQSDDELRWTLGLMIHYDVFGFCKVYPQLSDIPNHKVVGLSSQDDKLSNALVHDQIPAKVMASPSVSAVFSFRNWISFIAK